MHVDVERQVGHEYHRVADVGGVHARLRRERAVRLPYTLRHALGHRADGVADVDLAAHDVVGAAVERDGLGEPCHAVLGRGVGRRPRPRHVRGDGSVIDDAPAARVLVLHHAERRLRAQEHAGQVDVHHRLPLLKRQILERHAWRVAAGVVEQRVQAAELFLDPGEQRRDLVRLADVGGHHQRVA